MKKLISKTLYFGLITVFLSCPCVVFGQNDNDAANKKYVDNLVEMLPEPPEVLQEMSGESETAVLSVKAVKNAIEIAVMAAQK